MRFASKAPKSSSNPLGFSLAAYSGACGTFNVLSLTSGLLVALVCLFTGCDSGAGDGPGDGPGDGTGDGTVHGPGDARANQQNKVQGPQSQIALTAEQSHQQMVERLAAIVARVPEENRYFGDREYRQMKQLASRGQEDIRGLGALMEFGHRCLKLGKEREAIGAYSDAYKLLENLKPGLPEEQAESYLGNVSFWLGMSYLRLGETENCCQRNTPDSCILPIQGSGIHTKPDSSLRAISWFRLSLRNVDADSADYARCKWLLNIAYMTVGKYPHDVPASELIEPGFFESADASFPQFENVSQQLGIDSFSCAGGAVVDDFDNDLDLDLFVSDSDPAGPLRYFRNDGDQGFREMTAAANLKGITGGLNINHADFNNDGFLDLFVMRGGWFGAAGQTPNSLLRNNGDGTFTDITFLSGLGDTALPSQTASWADYDLDGDLDLLIGNEPCERPSPLQLFRNNGDETFSNVSAAAGIAVQAYTKGVIWGDFDQDRWPDFYVSNYDGANQLFRNNGDGSFTDVAGQWGVAGPEISFPCWFWDYDNDGRLDLLVNPYSNTVIDYAAFAIKGENSGERIRLYRNTGEKFVDVAESAGLGSPHSAMGSNFGDLNNDGYLDFYLGTGWPQFEELMPNIMYMNNQGQGFQDVTMAARAGHIQKGHGVVFADLDHDGDQDLFVEMGGAFPGDRFFNALFRNPGFGNRFLVVQLVGRQSNRFGVGCRLRADLEIDGQMRSVYKTVNSGGTFGSNPYRQHIGLGSAERVKRLVIEWPASDTQLEFEGLEVNQFLRITEGEQQLETLPYEPFEF